MYADDKNHRQGKGKSERLEIDLEMSGCIKDGWMDDEPSAWTTITTGISW